MANYIFPFITTTYLIRTIGIGSFGKVEFATLIVLYFITITNFEFHVSGTRYISRTQTDPQKINDYVSTAITAKAYLFLFSSILFLLLTLIRPSLFANYLFATSFLIVIGHLFYQPYLFQGLGKVRVLAVLNLSIKVISTLLIFLLVRSKENYEVVNLNYSISYIMVGIVSMALAKHYFEFRFSWKKLSAVKKCLRDGFYIFLTNGIIAQLSLNLSAVLLGLYLDETVLGSYAAAMKIVIAFHVLALMPLKQVFFPTLSYTWINNRPDYYKKFKTYTSLLLVVNLLVALGILLFAPLIIKIFYGDYFEKMIFILRMMAFLPLLAGLTNAYVNDGLIAMGKDRLVFRIQFVSVILNVTSLLVIVPLFGLTGTLITRIIVDFATLFAGVILYYKNLRKTKSAAV